MSGAVTPSAEGIATAVVVFTTARGGGGGGGGDRSVGSTAPHTGEEHVGFALPARGGCPARTVSFVCSVSSHVSSYDSSFVVRLFARGVVVVFFKFFFWLLVPERL